jgi:hypothetical protein
MCGRRIGQNLSGKKLTYRDKIHYIERECQVRTYQPEMYRRQYVISNKTHRQTKRIGKKTFRDETYGAAEQTYRHTKNIGRYCITFWLSSNTTVHSMCV